MSQTLTTARKTQRALWVKRHS